jgi:hypothetical protein
MGNEYRAQPRGDNPRVTGAERAGPLASGQGFLKSNGSTGPPHFVVNYKRVEANQAQPKA